MINYMVLIVNDLPIEKFNSLTRFIKEEADLKDITNVRLKEALEKVLDVRCTEMLETYNYYYGI